MKYQRKPHVIAREADGVVYILEPRTATVHALNDTASFLWNELKTPKSIPILTNQLCKHYAVDRSQASRDIKEFISRYVKLGFLTSK